MRNLPNLKDDFVEIPLAFQNELYTNIFALKNNKTVRETLQHPRYQKLHAIFSGAYADLFDRPLGEALLLLKMKGDLLYQRFLNKYGDQTFSVFRLANHNHEMLKGVYAYYENDTLTYIGRCKDSMKKRINQGYGKIHPKNCYIDGQATNCHLNGLITASKARISLRMFVIDAIGEIEDAERSLIREHSPPWNIQRG